MTNTLLKRYLIKSLWVVGLLYNFVNFCVTKATGVAIYAFLDWTTWRSPAMLLGLMSAFTGIYFTMCTIDGLVKKKLLKQQGKL